MQRVLLFWKSKTTMKTVKEITLSAKGQIVIPVDFREALALEAGDKLIIRQDGQALVLERRRDVLDALQGKYATPGRSLANELHDERWAERAKR
jgi:AbrB family looped-hinge helix DNA binding protein